MTPPPDPMAALAEALCYERATGGGEMSVKEAEARIYGGVFRCEEHAGYCYNGWTKEDGTTQHLPYLGWTCGRCHRSSSTPGQPLMFSDHHCGIGVLLGAVLPPLVLGLALFVALTLLVTR